MPYSNERMRDEIVHTDQPFKPIPIIVCATLAGITVLIEKMYKLFF